MDGLGRTAWAVAAVVLAPVLSLAVLASHGSGALWPHLARYVVPEAATETLLLLLGVGVIVTVVGTGTAWLVAAHDFPGRAMLAWALLLPLAMPTYLVAFAYLDVLHPLGPVQSLLRAVLALDGPQALRLPELRSLPGCAMLIGFVLYPYVYLNARAAFTMQGAAALHAARGLGASGMQLFLRIALPLAWPAVAVGVGLALMETLNDVGATEFLGVHTLTLAVYTTWINRSSVEGAAGIALILLLLVAAVTALERWGRRGGFRIDVAHPLKRQPLRPVAGAMATLACTLPVLLGFGVPALHFVVVAARRLREAGLPTQLGTWALNSALIAGAATIVVLMAGLLLAFTARVTDRAGPLRLGNLGYAVPGTIVALGLLMLLGLFDNTLDGVARSVLGVSTGLLLSGSGAALVLAYAIRFMAVPGGGLEAGYAQLPLALDHAAQAFGARRGRLLFHVHLPLLTPALVAAALLVFIDCMKELPATLLLRPLNLETLATAVYGEAARGTYEDGAVAALAIVLLGLAPVLLLGVRRRPVDG